jgi:hypothetical protein
MEYAIEIPWPLTGREDTAAVEARVRRQAQWEFPKAGGFDHSTLAIQAPMHDEPLTHPTWTSLRRYRAHIQRTD